MVKFNSHIYHEFKCIPYGNVDGYFKIRISSLLNLYIYIYYNLSKEFRRLKRLIFSTDKTEECIYSFRNGYACKCELKH